MQDRKLIKTVEKEEFDKLSQLDRIEYRQKEDRINKEFNSCLSLIVAIIYIPISSYILILATAGYGRFGEVFFWKIIHTLKFLTFSFIIVWIIGLLLDLLLLVRLNKAKRQLKDEYFKLELKIVKDGNRS